MTDFCQQLIYNLKQIICLPYLNFVGLKMLLLDKIIYRTMKKLHSKKFNSAPSSDKEFQSSAKLRVHYK